VLVTAGGVGVAAAASVIAILESSQTTANDAINGTLRVLAIAILTLPPSSRAVKLNAVTLVS
jgi:hypothetical protein